MEISEMWLETLVWTLGDGFGQGNQKQLKVVVNKIITLPRENVLSEKRREWKGTTTFKEKTEEQEQEEETDLTREQKLHKSGVL